MWSWISVPSTYIVRLRASCAWDRRISVLFPHSFCMESQASLAVPVVTTPRLATSVQLRVMCPLASWSLNFHSSREGVLEYMGVLLAVGWIVAVGVVGSGTDSGPGFWITPSIYPDSPFDASSWIMFVFHWSKLSPLNFCSSESIVRDGVPDICFRLGSVWFRFCVLVSCACRLDYLVGVLGAHNLL